MLDHIFISLPTLKTERLVLRKLVYSDRNDIFKYAQNPEVAKHLLWEPHQNISDTIEFLNIVYSAYNKNKAAPWGITLVNNDRIIGTAGFVSWDRDKKNAELGYALSQEYWNKGIGTEAVREVIKFGLEVLQLVEITATVKPNNIASIKLLGKSGFNPIATRKGQMIIKDKLENVEIYKLVREDYLTKLNNNE